MSARALASAVAARLFTNTDWALLAFGSTQTRAMASQSSSARPGSTPSRRAAAHPGGDARLRRTPGHRLVPGVAQNGLGDEESGRLDRHVRLDDGQERDVARSRARRRQREGGAQFALGAQNEVDVGGVGARAMEPFADVQPLALQTLVQRPDAPDRIVVVDHVTRSIRRLQVFCLLGGEDDGGGFHGDVDVLWSIGADQHGSEPGPR